MSFPLAIGAWLGFHATDGLLAILTAIAAAFAGVNLTLILLDMSRARSTRRQRHGHSSLMSFRI